MAREEKSNVINRDMNKDEKLKALDAALTQIEKAYGKGSVMKLGDSRANMNIETVPRFHQPGHCTGIGRSSQGQDRRGIWT